jgi:hypothetical protein
MGFLDSLNGKRNMKSQKLEFIIMFLFLTFKTKFAILN